MVQSPSVVLIIRVCFISTLMASEHLLVHLQYVDVVYSCTVRNYSCRCFQCKQVPTYLYRLRQPTNVARIVSMQVSMRILQHMCTKFVHPIGVIFIANCSTHVHLNYNQLLHVCRACMCMFSLKVFSLRQPTNVARIVSMQVSMRILQHMCTKFCTPHWCYLYCKL